jgi:YD repeat-containing protein
MRFYFLFISIFFCSLPRLSAQPPSEFAAQQETNVLPPSPNASNLGKYSGLDLNLSTGMINQSIPLYTFNSINLSLPISLSYTSSGVRVNDMGGSIGTSWNLNVGGVITRTVLGKVDERSQRLTSPGGSPNGPNADYLTFMDLLATGVDDGQPDIFSFNFNGYSGRFILDTLGNPFLLNYSNVKIQTYSDGSAQLLFKLITGDGVQYFFGGDDATELSLTYQGGSGCSVSYPDETATSWYLKQIVHPNGDTISFTYRKNVVRYITSISQAKYGRDWAAGFDRNCPSYVASAQPAFQDVSCPNTFETDIATLMEINSTSGAKVKFRHISRKDINDSLVSAIECYQSGKSTPFKSFSLSYYNAVASGYWNDFTSDSSFYYRHFLTSFSENDSNYAAVKRYSLTYNDIDGLAPRLSYAQDDYGFFNGRDNGGLIPDPHDSSWSNAIPTAAANRDPDTAYSFQGVLTKITYPTGGSDSIAYEANTVYTHETVYPPQVNGGAEALTDVSTAVATETFSFSVNYAQTIQINAIVAGRPGFIQLDGDSYAEIQLTDVTTSEEVFNNFLTLFGTPTGQYIVSLTPGHSYLLSVLAGGHGLDADASFQYQSGDTTSIFYNKVIFGGPRVAKVISKPDGISTPMTKHYFYSDILTPTDLGTSSPSLGGLVYNANYKQYLKVPTPCSVYVTDDPSDPRAGINQSCTTDYYYFYSIYSNPLIGLYTFSSIPISYRSVYESEGENFENGGTRHDFEIVQDQPAAVLTGNRINGVAMDSYAWINGKEIYTKTFKTNGEQFIPIREVFTHYNTDTRRNKITYSYTAEKLAQQRCTITNTPEEAAPYYNMNLNAIWQSWVYPDSVVTITYDQNGVSTMSDTVKTEYGNVSHAMPTAISRGLSNGTYEVQNMYYPDDLTLAGQPEIARQALLNAHIVSPVLNKKVIRGGTQVFAQNTDYAVFSNGYALPATASIQVRNQPVQKMVEFYRYDPFGKLQEQSRENDGRQVYIWDYQHVYPIAAVQNADSASVAFTSFEADGTGNWSVGSTYRDTAAMTGSKSYYLNSDISKSGLNSSATYFVSYWTTNNSSFSITGTIAGYPVKGKTVSLNNQHWTLWVHKITGQTSITISGSGLIDELRLYPATAQMTTYTYSPLIGMASQCDAGNRITYYEYDGLGRLKRVRDQDYNILKSLEYQYQVSQ